MINKEMLNMNVVVVAVLIKRNLKRRRDARLRQCVSQIRCLSSALILNSEAH
jgi:hypothetical protein